MSELFTQTNKQKKLFRTEEDIVANIQTQFGMPHTGKDLLLDAKMGPNKNQSSRLDSEPDALSDTGMSDDVGAGDTSGILHDSAGGNKKTIAGTNTPRASRASAYYDLLRSQHKNGHYKAPAYRVVDTIESPLQAGASALNYHDDFDTDAVQNAGLHMAVAQTVVEGNIMAAAADSALAFLSLFLLQSLYLNGALTFAVLLKERNIIPQLQYILPVYMRSSTTIVIV